MKSIKFVIVLFKVFFFDFFVDGSGYFINEPSFE